ncbi:MAG: hypothetical protein ABIW79_00520, partial [Gemmatimonas sp.]
MTALLVRCVEVALPAPLFRTFTYSVPDGIAMPIPAGSRVVVSFRNRREIGIVLGEVIPPIGVSLKPIDSVADEVPSLPGPLLDTGRWIADWFAAPLGLTLRGMLPAALTGAGVSMPAPKTQRVARLLQELPSLLQREKMFVRAKQQGVVYELLEAQGGMAPVQALLQQAACSAGVITAMAKRGLIEVRDEVVQRDPFADRPGTAPPPVPSAAQRAA